METPGRGAQRKWYSVGEVSQQKKKKVVAH
jgi:hypothetical protein